MTDRERLALIDGHALAYRAFHALSSADLRTSRGEPTYAVYGFLNIMLNMINDHAPHYVVVAFDVGRTFRDDLYAEYKAGRAETPAEFYPQLDRIKQVVRALNIPIYAVEGYEADDVIGTLSRQATAQNVETIILTGDTDTLQLVDDHVRVLLANPNRGRGNAATMYSYDDVVTRYDGLRPDQLADLRGLKGDTSDNIPGVAGIGDKSAITLLNEFGTIEALYERFDEVPVRFRKKLDGQRETALFSKQLAQIVCDVAVSFDPAAARLSDYDQQQIIDLFYELEFGSSLVQKLPTVAVAAPQATVPVVAVAAPATSGTQQLSMFAADSAPTAEVPDPAAPGVYVAVQDDAALQVVVQALTLAEAFAFDLESTGTDPLRDAPVGIALAVRQGAAWYIPFAHTEGQQLDRATVLHALRPFFADAGKPKYAHNAKFDCQLLEQAGVPVVGVAFDTMLAARLLNKRVGLKELAFYELRLPHPLTDITELIGTGKQQITFDRVPIARATPYAAADADMTLRLQAVLATELESYPQIKWVFETLELPLIPVIAAMERAGIGFDQPYMAQLHERLQGDIAALEADIHKIAGSAFNIQSPIQLSQVLFEQMNLPTTGLSKTSSGRYSLTADALDHMATQLAETAAPHDERLHILRLILRYRQLRKLMSTYVEALPALVNPATRRIHTSYNQLGAATGRLSSTHPNMQNIPVRTDEGGEIRRAFVAAPGHVLVAADYSQIELRVLAHISEDPALIDVFQRGQDIHAATAARLFNIEPGAVDKQQRRIAKTVVFGVIYGISSFGLAQRTGMPRAAAQQMIDALLNRFPAIQQYIDATLTFGQREGYVASLFGRRRWMPELQSKGARRAAAEREAINAPIQATAADIMKMAMRAVDRALRDADLQTRMLLQVHDELILEAPHAEAEQVQQLVRDAMENVLDSMQPPFKVPLDVNIATATNWEEIG